MSEAKKLQADYLAMPSRDGSYIDHNDDQGIYVYEGNVTLILILCFYPAISGKLLFKTFDKLRISFDQIFQLIRENPYPSFSPKMLGQ